MSATRVLSTADRAVGVVAIPLGPAPTIGA
jgi:hypothetical protein